MRTRPIATGLLLGLVPLILILATTASGYLYKKPAGHDCGKATLVGGFGGPAPSNVPADAKPEIHTFIVKGKISCAVAKRVMDKREKSFVTSPGKGVSPAGWKCGFSAKLKGQSCTNSKHVVLSNGIVYVSPKA